MREFCLGVLQPEVVENALIGDLPRQTNILRSDSVGRITHQRAPPMGRRPGDVRDALCAGPAKKIRCWLLRSLEHQRGSSESGAKKDLQSTETPNVVERAPHNGRRCGSFSFNRTSETRQRVHGELGKAGGAGGKKNPFGFEL